LILVYFQKAKEYKKNGINSEIVSKYIESINSYINKT